MPNTLTICDCGHAPSKHETPGGTGYGIGDSGLTYCYDCCAMRDAVTMTQTGRATLYLAEDGAVPWRLTNWPGTLVFVAHSHNSKWRGHNWGLTRRDVWF